MFNKAELGVIQHVISSACYQLDSDIDQAKENNSGGQHDNLIIELIDYRVESKRLYNESIKLRASM